MSGGGGIRIGDHSDEVVSALDPSRWIDRHGSAMFAYARLRLPSADLAEEAVQEALASAWRSRNTYAGRSTERTWLIGVLRYKVLDLIAARTRAMSGKGAAAVLAERTGHGTGGEHASACGVRWDRTPEGAEARAAIESALNELPDLMRQALVLREVDGLSGQRVCEILGITETNLWTMVHRAKARMRVALAARFGDD